MSKDSIRIEINGVEFTDFETVSVTRSVESFHGIYRFTGSTEKQYNIKKGSACRIFVNNKVVITGYVFKIKPEIGSTSHIINVEGKDRTADLSDSSLPSSVTITGGTTLEKIIRQVLNSLNMTSVKVINRVSGLAAFSSNELIDSEPDQKAFSFIDQYANKRSVILTTNGDGNIEIIRGGTERIIDKLIDLKSDPDRKNNILSSSSDNNDADRFYKITIISQDNSLSSGAEFSENTVSISGFAIDSQIRKSRQLTIQAENASNSQECKDIATLQVNIRRAKSLNYTAKVQGFSLNNGGIWDINQIVGVQDESAKVTSELLIRECTYDFSNNGGSSTSMSLVTKDAYTLQADLDKIQARQNKTSEGLSTSGPIEIDGI